MVQLPNDEYAQLIGERDSLAADLTRLRRDNATLLAALTDLFGADMETCMRWDGKDDQLEAIAKALAAIAQAQEP